MAYLKVFSRNGLDMPVKYIETQHVKNGVECDIYEFTDDTSKDLGIIRVNKNISTPLQKVIKGNKTIEGFISGKGTLVIGYEKKVQKSIDFQVICTQTRLKF